MLSVRRREAAPHARRRHSRREPFGEVDNAAENSSVEFQEHDNDEETEAVPCIVARFGGRLTEDLKKQPEQKRRDDQTHCNPQRVRQKLLGHPRPEVQNSGAIGRECDWWGEEGAKKRKPTHA